VAKKGFQTTAAARAGRARGHQKAKEFALIIGLPTDYENNPAAKKDVIDKSGDSHSLKSGKKKWQIFLYSRNRVDTDPGFRSLNGFSKLLVALLDAFPDTYGEYLSDKQTAKNKLKIAQEAVANKLNESIDRIEGFFHKAMFDGGQVDYLTVYGEADNKYHVFHRDDVLGKFKHNLLVENSKARGPTQVDGQKTIFKLNEKNFAELEVRNEEIHYREIRFNMMAPMALDLFKTIDLKPKLMFQDHVLVYGKAKKTFKG
jgi:hypothetical protein